MIKIENASKKIKDQWVLKGITLDLPDGAIYGFQGRNGSGKTMLFRAITGLILLTEGFVAIDGKKVSESYVPQNVGLLLENPAFLRNMSGKENLKMNAMMMPHVKEEEIDALLEKVGLGQTGHKPFKNYSLGMKQRLGVASALLGNPDLIILDEPTNAMDEEGIELLHGLIRELKEQGKTILIASHEREILEDLADEIIHMKQGEVIEIEKRTL